MLKKTLLSAAIASTFALSGCLDSTPETGENVGSVTNPDTESSKFVFPVFSPVESKLPIPNDLIFDDAADGTFVDLGPANPLDSSTADQYNPVTAALGGLSGASTAAPIDIPFSGLIEESSVSASPYVLDANGNLVLNGSNPIPNPLQNVFLLEMKYGSGDPLQALPIGEPPTIEPAAGDTYTHEILTLDGNSVIRIHPKTPLKPLTRYVVVITDSIRDTVGNQIKQSPGAGGYETLTKTDAESKLQGALTALAPVRKLINSFWEPTAQGWFDNATNLSRAANSLDPIDTTNIAMSYSFMTSGDEKVLNYIADPQQWFNDQVTRFIGITASKMVVGYQKQSIDQYGYPVFDGNGDPVYDEDYKPGGANHNPALYGLVSLDGTTTDAVAALTGQFPAFLAATDPTLPATLTGIASLAGGTCATPPAAGTGFIDCFGKGLVNLPPISSLLPTPEAAEIDFTGATPVVHPEPTYGGSVSIVEGTMKVPYYSRPPADIGTGAAPGDNAGAGAPIKYLSWEADTTLAAAINTTFASLGLKLPQGTDAATGEIIDPADENAKAVSDAVNYIFPFPKQQDTDPVADGVQDMTIPIMVAYPTTGGTGMKTMIMGHGLGGSRSIALGGTGSGLVAQALTLPLNLAVVAIDQPLHGLKEDEVVGGTTVLSKSANERHFGYAEAGSGLPPRPLTADDNTSLLFVNVESFLTTRDNNRQNALDLLALRKAIGGIDLDGMSGAGTDLNGSDVYYQGYSLGTISAQAMAAVANDANQTDSSGAEVITDNFKSAFFSTPGGGIARFFENSPSFAGSIVEGLAGAGLTYDTANYQTFLNTVQASFDAFDAINFVQDYKTDADFQVLYYTASNDQVIPVSQLPGRTLDAPAGTVLTVDTSTTPPTPVSYTVDVKASASYLSGAEPLLAQSGATALPAGVDQAVTRNFIRWAPGSGSHGGPCEATGTPGTTEFGGYAFKMLLDQAVTNSGTFIDEDPIEDFFIDPTQCAANP